MIFQLIWEFRGWGQGILGLFGFVVLSGGNAGFFTTIFTSRDLYRMNFEILKFRKIEKTRDLFLFKFI